MIKNVRVGYATSPQSKFSEFFDKVETLLTNVFDKNTTEIMRESRGEINEYMSRNIFPSYDPSDAEEMRQSMRMRVDRRKGGNALSIYIAHPLLYMREFGETTEGMKTIRASSGGALAIPYERAVKSKALQEKAAKAKALAEERYGRAMKSRQNRIKAGLPGGQMPVMPLAFVFLDHVHLKPSPFMGDLQEIVYLAMHRVAEQKVMADVKDAIGKAAGA